MKQITTIFLLVLGLFIGYQTTAIGQNSSAYKTTLSVSGRIRNYSNQALYLYQCGVSPALGGRDTLLFVDSTHTNKNGKFSFSVSQNNGKQVRAGLYKITLQRNQWFYILCDGNPVKISTSYVPSPFYNIATDSLQVIKSEENKVFYKFQHLQKQIVVADNYLLKMMRLYPLLDPFHKEIEAEYHKRYKAMDAFVKNTRWAKYPESKRITYAYFIPENPDWKQPDPWRDSIMAAHYFDYFNPADGFYLHTNILLEKMNLYLTLRTNKRDAYGQPVNNPQFLIQAAKDFLNHTESNEDIFRFCLSYLLKIADKEHQDQFFLSLYDEYLQTQQGDCGSTEEDDFYWARQKANVLRGVQIGSIAPDFQIMEGKLNLHGLPSDYTLLVFWASWCPHCTTEIPKIKVVTDSLSAKLQSAGKMLTVIAISLDRSQTEWKKYVQKHNLFTWLNSSELKGWKGDIPKRYNVYATPTMFLLDKDKKIIAKPISYNELKQAFKEIIY